MASNTTAPLPPGSFDSRVPTTIGVTILCLSIASAVVVMRIYTRGWIINQMGVDDYFAVASLLMAYGAGIAILCMMQFGLGHHIWMLPNMAVNIPLYLRSFYVSIVLYCAGLFTIKMTFLVQYYRVFGVQDLRKIFILAILIVGAWSLSQLHIGIFICTPIRGFWDLSVPNPRCVPNYPQFYVNAAGNIATDVAVLVMPFPLLKRLRLPRRQKSLLFAIFGLGFFTVAISVLRIKYLKLFEDFTWENVESSAWSVGELCSGITCACLPTLRPLLRAHFPGLGTRLTGDEEGYEGGYGGGVETAAAVAAAHKRAGSGDSSQPSMEEAEGSGSARAGERSNIEGGESTEDIMGLETMRGRRHMEEADENRDARLGLRMTVLSRVDAGGRSEVSMPPPVLRSGGGIQVQRAVYQVEKRRGT